MNTYFSIKIDPARRWSSSVIFTAVLLFGCDYLRSEPFSGIPLDSAPTTSVPSAGTRISLTLMGFNYTNRYIDDFSADGQGGGNLRVSGPGSGGGGSTCCVSYFPGAKSNFVTVRWQADRCVFLTRSTDGTEIFEKVHSYFKQVEVPIETDNRSDAKYLSVHFYPDGTVKAAVSEHRPAPRLALDPSRADRNVYSRCANDKKPQ